MATTEDPELRALRTKYDQARANLLAGIRKKIKDGVPLAKIGRSVDWSREYIAQIRDGKVKD